jgi:hypothetical protein
MFDRVELIEALNSILGLMFDELCQARSRLAIYEKVRKISLSAQFSVERYIVSLIILLASRSHHQAVLIIKSFSSPSRSHHQVVLIIKPFSSPSRRHHQANLPSQPTKPTYQATLSSHPTKPPYQANLPSQPTKSPYQATLSSRSKHPKATVASDRSKRP